MKKLRIKDSWRSATPWLWLLGAYVWDIWYQIFRGRVRLDSDMASEMILADILNKEHSISGLTTNWIYSTEIKFFHMQWFYRLGLLFFPHNWHAARTLAMALALALLAFAVWLVFYAIDRKAWGIWAAAFCLFPGGGWYFWQTLYGGFYLPYLYISLFSTALILLAEKNRKSFKGVVFMGILSFLGFASGMNGIKQWMVFYAPLTLATFLLFCHEVHINYRGKNLERSVFAMDCFFYLFGSLMGGYVLRLDT